MAIVMGLDQHRAQITAEWIDTESGEISRTRVAPADREGVRRFLGRFSGRQLEVALEARTGWRFVVEELRAVGARAHLAEPAETSALRGTKKHAKSDRADARHLRELLMTGRLPECWIAPDHILDLRAKVRLRHGLVDERGEWQQRIRAVLYHHGFPRRSDLDLLTAAGRDWLTELSLPAAARDQITIALRMIVALDAEIPAIDKQLRSFARRQPGCRALMGHFGDRRADLGRDPRRARRLPAVLLLPVCGPLRRAGHHRARLRPPACGRPPLPPGTTSPALGAL
jgi:transposase